MVSIQQNLKLTSDSTLTASIFVRFVLAIGFIVTEQFLFDTFTIAALQFTLWANWFVGLEIWQHFAWFCAQYAKVTRNKKRRRRRHENGVINEFEILQNRFEMSYDYKMSVRKKIKTKKSEDKEETVKEKYLGN